MTKFFFIEHPLVIYVLKYSELASANGNEDT